MGARDTRLDAARLLGNLAICGRHAYPFMYAAGHDVEFWFWSFFSLNVCILAMPMFFLVSGYLLFQNYSWGVYGKKMVSRIKRLYVPLIVWNIIACVVVFSLGLVNARAKVNVDELGLGDFAGWLRQLRGFGVMANGVLWYLRAVLVFALCSPVLFLLYRYLHWLVVLTICVGLVVLFPNLTRSDFPVYGISLFALGGLAAYRQVNVFDLIERLRWLFLSLSLSVVVVSCVLNYGLNSPESSSPLFRFLGVSFFMILGIALAKLKSVRRLVDWLMPAGFMIYLGHGIVFPCFMHGLGSVIPSGSGKMSVIAILTIVLTVTFCSLVWHGLNRYCPKFLRVIDGRW